MSSLNEKAKNTGTAESKVVFITGASSGIGKAIAEYLAVRGYKVYGTSRHAVNGTVAVLDASSSEFPKVVRNRRSKKWQAEQEAAATKADDASSSGFLKMVNLDICDNESVDKAVQYVLDEEGKIDVLVNNAGFGISGPIEETTVEEAQSQFNTNFFGMHRMCRRVLPAMRAEGSGLIINIGSVAGLISIPFQSMYSASKYAIEAYTDALRLEVREFGIKAVVIEPGDTKTGFTDNRYFCEQSKESAYKKSSKSVEKMMHDERNGDDPGHIARIVCGLINRKSPPPRVTVGLMYKTFVFLKRILPDRFVEFVVGMMYS